MSEVQGRNELTEKVRKCLHDYRSSSELLVIADLRDPSGLVVKLRDKGSGAYKHLWDQLSEETQQLLSSDDAGPSVKELQTALVDELNRLLPGKCLYDRQDFEPVRLSDEAKALLGQNPRGRDMIRLNRILLAEVYPRQIGVLPEGLEKEIADCFWEEILRFFERRVLRQDADDLRQEVFLRAFSKVHRFRGEASLQTWIYRIALNLLKDYPRARHENKEVPWSQLDDGIDEPMDEDKQKQYEPVHGKSIDDPGKEVERREWHRKVRAAVVGLGQDQQVAVRLFYFEHRSVAEIAAVMGRSHFAVKMLLTRARRALRRRLEPLAREWDLLDVPGDQT